jgi:hypothetical protein
LIPNYKTEGDAYPLPPCPELWNYVQQTAASESNQKRVASSFNGYIYGLLERCEGVIDKRMVELKATKEEKAFLENKIETLKLVKEEIKSELMEPAFKEILDALPSKLSRTRNTVRGRVYSKIDEADKFRESEVTAYVNTHMLQFEIKKEVDEIRSYLDAKLRELDRKVQDKLNTVYAQIEKEIELHFSVAMANMINGTFKKLGGKILEQSLLNYFSQFAGRGGTGIANGAKHLLKKLGDLFGKTFSREAHNKLAHVLSKIGATSAKAVGAAVAVVIEAIVMIVDILTWQGKLKKAVDKGLDAWYNEVVVMMSNDINQLKEENMRLLDQDISLRIEAFSADDENLNLDDTEKLQTMLLDVKTELGDYDE